jgi:hypothetical protein
MNVTWLAGVDGCSGGWIVTSMRPDGGEGPPPARPFPDPLPRDAYGLPMAIRA